MTKYLGFDIEVCSWPEDEDTHWREAAPLGISCVGLFGTAWDESEVYYAGTPAGPTARVMNKEELEACWKRIKELVDEGYKLVGWNSLGFDLACIHVELESMGSELADEVKETAKTHIDPMFEIFCTYGWFVGLDTVAHGLGLPGKLQDISGKEVPDLWMNGTDEDRQKILTYVGQDARATSDIVEVGTRMRNLHWKSRTNRPYRIVFSPPLNVRECLQIPKPDTKWMDNPAKREDFYSWLTE